MGLSRIVSDIDGDFSRKSQKFTTPLYFASPLKGFHWNWVSALGVEKLEWWGYWAEKEVWRYLKPSGYNPPTWWTDRRTDTGQQQRSHLRIASRGKKKLATAKRMLSNTEIQNT